MAMEQGRNEEMQDEDDLRMTDERRMRESGAEESGYHAPSEQDIQDIRKDHHTSTSPHAVNADEFIRHGSSTDQLQGAEEVANMHPHEGPSVEQGRSIGTVADMDVGRHANSDYPSDPTPESQTTNDRKGWQGAKRAMDGAGVDGDLDLEGPTDGVVSAEQNQVEEDDNLERRTA
jgi:hypothetical protein